LQRYKILFISGTYSRILSRLNWNITERDVRRANTLFQLMTILEENHHSFLIVEHDPLLYEDSREMVGLLGPGPQADLQGGHGSCFCSTMRDPTGRRWTGWLTLLFCIYNEPAAAKNRGKLRRGCLRPRELWRHTHEGL